MKTQHIASALILGLCTTATSLADLVGVLDIAGSNGASTSTTLNGLALPDGSTYWTHQYIHEELTVSTTMVASPIEDLQLATIMQFSNSGTEDLQVEVAFSMTLSTLPPPLSEWLASQSLNIGGEDAMVETDTEPLWSVVVDDTLVASLFDNPFSFSAGQSGSASTYDTGNGTVFIDNWQTLQVRYAVDLSAGTTVGFNGGFAFVPTAASLWTLAPMLATRRRRRH
ncbi:MAG: hypothetical protein MK077_08120 [Phycisphaerales bacterium]|nr:hypothetical protein [Phycisphaerales bacterium]